MKIVWREGEQERIVEARDEASTKIFSDDPEKEYSINFTVTNPAIAEYVLFSLLNDRLSEVNIGINVTSINFEKYESQDALKQRLIRMIEEM